MTGASYWASTWKAAWFLKLTDLAGTPVNDRHRLAGIVDKQYLTDSVLLTHHDVRLAGPGSEMLAEPRLLDLFASKKRSMEVNKSCVAVCRGSVRMLAERVSGLAWNPHLDRPERLIPGRQQPVPVDVRNHGPEEREELLRDSRPTAASSRKLLTDQFLFWLAASARGNNAAGCSPTRNCQPSTSPTSLRAHPNSDARYGPPSACCSLEEHAMRYRIFGNIGLRCLVIRPLSERQ